MDYYMESWWCTMNPKEKFIKYINLRGGRYVPMIIQEPEDNSGVKLIGWYTELPKPIRTPSEDRVLWYCIFCRSLI